MLILLGVKQSYIKNKKNKNDYFSSWFPAPPEPMSLLYWNCWGLGNQCTENQLAKSMWAKDPSVVFLAETWIDEAKLILIQDRLKFKQRFIAPRRNKSRGLVMY